jgi:hypothetical protein
MYRMYCLGALWLLVTARAVPVLYVENTTGVAVQCTVLRAEYCGTYLTREALINSSDKDIIDSAYVGMLNHVSEDILYVGEVAQWMALNWSMHSFAVLRIQGSMSASLMASALRSVKVVPATSLEPPTRYSTARHISNGRVSEIRNASFWFQVHSSVTGTSNVVWRNFSITTGARVITDCYPHKVVLHAKAYTQKFSSGNGIE